MSQILWQTLGWISVLTIMILSGHDHIVFYCFIGSPQSSRFTPAELKLLNISLYWCCFVELIEMFWYIEFLLTLNQLWKPWGVWKFFLFFLFDICKNCATTAVPCPHSETELVFRIGIIFVLGYIVLNGVRVSQKNKGTSPAASSETMGFVVFCLV